MLYLVTWKYNFARPLLAFNVEDGLKIWTKFIEKIKIHPWQPNPEHFSNCLELLGILRAFCEVLDFLDVSEWTYVLLLSYI